MKSENNWSIIDSSQIDKSNVPGTIITPLPGVRMGDVAVVLLHVGKLFNERVEKLYNPGCWGWNKPEPIPGTNVYSNHASGTAVDFNAPSFPWKMYRMTESQVAACRQIVKEMDGVVRWGGDYTTFVDEMHFEIDASQNEVAALAKKIKQGEDMIGRDELRAAFRAFRGREPYPEEIEKYANKVNSNEMIQALDKGKERDLTWKQLEVGKVAVKDKWDKQISDLQKKNKMLEEQIDASGFTLLDKEVYVKEKK